MGGLALWVGGTRIGESDHREIVSVGLGTLVNAANKTGERNSALLSSMSALKSLELVMWAVYGDDDPKFAPIAGSRESLYPFEVLPQGGPFFDDWQAILLEEGDGEKFIFRKTGQEISEVTWEFGRFRNTVLEAWDSLAAIVTG